MIAIVLSQSEEVKKKLLENGYKEETVLLKFLPIQSTEENKILCERELRKLFNVGPFQFLVNDYWAASFE